LASTWSSQIEEAIVGFVRDFLALRAPVASRSSASEFNQDVPDGQPNRSR
jgi:hypothetical protein